MERGRKEREPAQEMRSEGLMLKHKDSPYAVGRKKGMWWKWKSDPKTIDAVLHYAMRGHGSAPIFIPTTRGRWQGEEKGGTARLLVDGRTHDAEIKQVDQFVKKNTTDRFGPVRQVKPELVFEIAFKHSYLSATVAVRLRQCLIAGDTTKK